MSPVSRRHRSYGLKGWQNHHTDMIDPQVPQSRHLPCRAVTQPYPDPVSHIPAVEALEMRQDVLFNRLLSHLAGQKSPKELMQTLFSVCFPLISQHTQKGVAFVVRLERTEYCDGGEAGQRTSRPGCRAQGLVPERRPDAVPFLQPHASASNRVARESGTHSAPCSFTHSGLPRALCRAPLFRLQPADTRDALHRVLSRER